MTHAHHTANIIIDKKHLTSPNPTTGQALYALGQVPGGYDLYREVHGKGDDVLIPNTSAVIELNEGEHFFSSKQQLNPGYRNGHRSH